MKLTDGEIPDGGERLRDEFLSRLNKCAEVVSDLVKAVDEPDLRTYLLEWAKRWHVDAEWVIESAFRTIRYYRETGALSYSPASLAWSEPSTLHLPPPRGFPIYYPRSMTREEYMREVGRQVLKKLGQAEILGPSISTAATAVMPEIIERAAEYCRQSEQELKPKKTGKRSRIENLKRDIDWTVRYQVQKQDFLEIAVRDEASQESVEKTVSRMLRELPLVPRNPRGRRRGGKNSPRASR